MSGHQAFGRVEDQLAGLLALLLFLGQWSLCIDHYRQTSTGFRGLLRSEFTLVESVAR